MFSFSDLFIHNRKRKKKRKFSKKMAYQNRFFEENKRDKYSQNGEDGCIQTILSKLGVSKGWVCEFGAWDGVYLSNTFALIEQGFRGVFIEGDSTKFTALQKTCQHFPNITPILSYVDHEVNAKNSLDNILIRTEIPHDFTLLSIDIDSFDYHVWQSLKNYRPRVVIIEINSAVTTSCGNWVHKAAPHMEGTGFRPMLELGRKKGYQLLAHTGNMIFIRDEDCCLFDILPLDPFTCFRTNWMEKIN